MDVFCGGGHHSSSLPGVTSGIEVYFGVPARLNLSEFRRKAIASENWPVRSEGKQINSHTPGHQVPFVSPGVSQGSLQGSFNAPRQSLSMFLPTSQGFLFIYPHRHN